MTRKQAIEAAYDAYEESGTVHAGLQSAYDAGRIAGLREAARTKHEDRDRTDRNFDWDRPWNDGHDSHAEAIRAHARELAKKVKEGR